MFDSDIKIIKRFSVPTTPTLVLGYCVIFDDRERACSARVGCDIYLNPRVDELGTTLEISVKADSRLVCDVELCKKPVVRVYIDDELAMTSACACDLYDGDSINIGVTT